jgi:WD40 repeat protein
MVAISPDSKLLAAPCYDGTLKVWDIGTGKEQVALTKDIMFITAVAFSPDGKSFAWAGCHERTGRTTVHFRDLASGRDFAILQDPPEEDRHLRFSPDGRTFAMVDWNGRIMVWDTAQRKPKQTFGGTGIVAGIDFSPDGRHLASVGKLDEEHFGVKLWDTARGREQATLERRPDWHWGIAFSPDGKMLACTSGEEPDEGAEEPPLGEIRLWEIATQRIRTTFRFRGIGGRLAFSPDGKLLASCAGKATRLWDLRTEKLCAVLTGHTATISGVAFSPNGKLLASAAMDRTVRLWDLANILKARK